MADNPRIRGKTVAERNESIEQALKSLTRRAVKRAVVYVQPVPLFMNCRVVPTDRIIGRIVIPFSGTLKDLVLVAGEMISKDAAITLELETLRDMHQTHFTISKRSERLEFSSNVEAGTVLRVILAEGDLVDILMAVAIYPVIEDHVAKQYLLDEILKDEEEPGNAVQN